MTIDLDKIERLVNAAPKGTWEEQRCHGSNRMVAIDPSFKGAIWAIGPVTNQSDISEVGFGRGVREYLEGVTPDVVSELVAEVRRLREHRDGPGSPSFRLDCLLTELRKRFPGAHSEFDSSSPEPKLLAAIDAMSTLLENCQKQRLELMGVVIDIENGTGFDDANMATIKRVMGELAKEKP